MTHGPIRLQPCPEGAWATCLDPSHVATTTLCRTLDAEREFLGAHAVEPDAAWRERAAAYQAGQIVGVPAWGDLL